MKDLTKEFKTLVKILTLVICEPLIATLTGFGIIWLYLLLDWNIWFSVFVGLFVSALTSRILLDNFKQK